ncbi:MAG: type III pantothenate kinase [Gammaproteobacteria bacterium]|nr:type III pantothenate kinase [Gammaproteobacteria bacterium]MBT8444513.1 type III pantothenate kinase [Gammaproteobacteria bacterium]NND35597.1 type III pantothenate kinase [Gammaproteobacteria bacterium]
MKLLIDIGNTRIKWATYSDGQLGEEEIRAHGSDPRIAATALLDDVSDPPAEILVANVAGPEFGERVAAQLGATLDVRVGFATSQKRAGRLRNAYRDHAKLGVDRWLAMLAAVDRFSSAVCVVDAGSAVTIDLVAADGDHLGGYILPGLDMMWRALTGDTGDLERFTEGDSPAGVSLAPGRDTAEAIGHGVLGAVCALIERCTGALAEDNGRVVVVTGGDAERIIPHLAVELEHRPQLVLEGLVLWAPR